jgi:hypothetical protein
MLMKYLLSNQATRETRERIAEWRGANDDSEAIVEGQRLLHDTDARVRLTGYGKLLSDIDGTDTRSKIRQRFLYCKLWQTVEDLMVHDKDLRGKSEKAATAIAKVRASDV